METLYEIDAYGIFQREFRLESHYDPISPYVTTAPPALKQNEVAMWAGDTWIKLQNYARP